MEKGARLDNAARSLNRGPLLIDLTVELHATLGAALALEPRRLQICLGTAIGSVTPDCGIPL